MVALSRILSIVMLVVHLMVGCCCSRHARGCESKLRSSPFHSDAALDEQGPQCGCDHSHHGTQGCQGLKCSWVSPRRTVSGSLIQPFQASFVAWPAGQITSVAIGSQQQAQATGRLLLSVRLHLANQILLI
ncbi:MAG: hypothetical protein ISR77_12305 [Pirellulaceae bacterium]|nr:hypothetical protein [Pirellulaceae bacterium]